MPDYIPRRDADVVSFTANVARRLVDGPSRYRIPADLAAEYAAVQDEFARTYQLTTQAATRSPLVLAAKDRLRAQVVAMTRAIGGQVATSLDVDDDARLSLGLRLRRPARRVMPVPSVAPALFVRAVEGRRVTLRIVDVAAPSRRSKPADVARALVRMHAGDAPPASADAWQYGRGATRTLVTIDVDDPRVPAGGQVWFTACWQDARGRSGPDARAVSAFVGAGIARLDAAVAA